MGEAEKLGFEADFLDPVFSVDVIHIETQSNLSALAETLRNR